MKIEIEIEIEIKIKKTLARLIASMFFFAW